MIFSFFTSSCTKENESKINENVTPSEKLDLRGAPTLPTVQSGILKFTSKAHLQEYFDYIETLDSDQQDALEASLGFNSLRKYYNDQFDSNNNFKQSLSFYIADPFLSSVLNTFNEFWVGADIYKYVDEHVFTTGTATHLTDFIDMRLNGNEGIVRPGLTVYDDKNNTEILSPRDNHCTYTLIIDDNSKGQDLYVRILAVDINGNAVSNCSATVTFNWGDGKSDTYTGQLSSLRWHKYTVPIGQGQIFNITVNFTTVFCGACDDGVPISSSLIGTYLAHNNTLCSPFESNRSWVVDDIIYNNGLNRFIITQGYDLNNNFWHDASAWGRITHFSFVNNKWKMTLPTHKLQINIHGTWFEESCTGTADPVSKLESKRFFDLKVLTKKNKNMMFRSDLQLYCDFQVFDLSPTIAQPSILNSAYWP